MEINQILPTFRYGDAIANESLEIRDLLRRLRYKSNIYASNINDGRNKIKKYNKYRGNENNILIWHVSTQDGLSKFISQLSDRKVIMYHNITPPEFFIGINDHLATILSMA